MPFCEVLLGYPRESRRDDLGRPLGCDPHAFQLAGRDARKPSRNICGAAIGDADATRESLSCRSAGRPAIVASAGGGSRLPYCLRATACCGSTTPGRLPAGRATSGLLTVTQEPSRNTGGAAIDAADATHESVFRRSAGRPAIVACAGGRNHLPHCLYAAACCGSVKLSRLPEAAGVAR